MSKGGVCRSFDEHADGVVILMRMDEALEKGYGIRAVISGHAINNDGRQKSSYSTTSPNRQVDCMREALAMIQIRLPRQEMDYVEAHGPGTPIGDLLEVQALTKAYASDADDGRQIYLGSVKTNLDHTLTLSELGQSDQDRPGL